MTHRAQSIVHCALALLAIGIAAPAAAQTYPTKSVRFIVAYAPGGGTDVTARPIAAKLSERWGQSVFVDNRAGGNGMIGADMVAKSAPDGYTVLVSASSEMSMNVALFSKMPYDPVKNFTPITLVSVSPPLLLVHPSLPVKNVLELVALAKRKPGALSYGSSGGGATPQLMMEMLKQKAGIDVVMITYKGTGGGQIVDQIAGRVEVAFNLSVGVIPFVKEGKLRALAISTARRLLTLAEVPTVGESGLKGVEGSSWQGIAMPAGVPHDIVRRVSEELVRGLKTPEMREKILVMGGIAVGNTPEEFAAFFHAESDKWYRVANAANVKLD